MQEKKKMGALARIATWCSIASFGMAVWQMMVPTVAACAGVG